MNIHDGGLIMLYNIIMGCYLFIINEFNFFFLIEMTYLTSAVNFQMILYLALQILKIRLKARLKKKCGFKAQCMM